jgi:hypothetical protein
MGVKPPYKIYFEESDVVNRAKRNAAVPQATVFAIIPFPF